MYILNHFIRQTQNESLVCSVASITQLCLSMNIADVANNKKFIGGTLRAERALGWYLRATKITLANGFFHELSSFASPDDSRMRLPKYRPPVKISSICVKIIGRNS